MEVENHAGGVAFEVSDLSRFRRFLILGCESGSYYQKAQQLGKDNCASLLRLLEPGRKAEALEAVATIAQVSRGGLAAKNSPALLALAMCARLSPSIEVRQAAYQVLPQVARIPTHLFEFIGFSELLGGGWGRMHKRGVQQWYLDGMPNSLQLAQTITKYWNRGGWTHRDVLRLAHPKATSLDRQLLFHYVSLAQKKSTEKMELLAAKRATLQKQQEQKVKADVPDAPETEEPAQDQEKQQPEAVDKLLAYLQAVETAKHSDDAAKVVVLIDEHRLAREHINTALLNEPSIWQALLQKMPLTALIRNLGKMTAVGALASGEAVNHVCKLLANTEALHRSRIHPYNVLVAMKTYSSGKGDRGSLTWEPIADISGALERAFYDSFAFVQPSGKRFMLALDVSGSMGGAIISGSGNISARVASAAMLMATLRSERHCHVAAFTSTLQDINHLVEPDMPLDTVVRNISGMPFGGTDCAAPMIYALENKLEVDVFVVYTDSETWCGLTSPAHALRKYREAAGIPNAKLIVVGMTSNGFSIADPNDPNMLDVVGFDSSAPMVMSAFATDQI